MRKITLTEMERNRGNELRLRDLVFKMLEATNDFTSISKYIHFLSGFMNFNADIIIDTMREVLEPRYKPTINELIKINLLYGLTVRQIAEKLNMNISTVKMHIYRNKYNINTIILYPRLQPYQLEELRKFFKQYYQLYVPINKFAMT